MKKLFVLLLSLLMVLSLPLTALATEADTAETSAVEDTSDTTTVGGADNSEADTSVEEDAPKTVFGFFPATLSETLPIMGMGMLGIFLVTSVIILAVLILSKLGKPDEED